MVSDVEEDSLALMNAPYSISVGRTKIRADRGDALKDVLPATFDGGFGPPPVGMGEVVRITVPRD
jgi:hypothetical protein